MRRLVGFGTGGLKSVAYAAALVLIGGAMFSVAAMSKTSKKDRESAAARHSQELFKEGRDVFRNETFGDEKFWGDTLQLHKAVEGAKHGGVGAGVDPATALAVGLKVDAKRIPPAVAKAIKAGKVDLKDPATTLALLKLDAVVGVKGHFSRSGKSLTSMGITCALCHSTVDNSFAPGIGHRLDGWPNRDLNVGAIVSLAPNLKPVADLLGADVDTVKKVLASWGPGKFDATLFLDGKAFRPDGKSAATLLPPAFGLAGVDRHTFTGWGSVTYWNAFVANLEMHGQGNFTDSRLDNAEKYPVAAKNRMGHTRNKVDLVSKHLPALHFYQLALKAPHPPRGSYDKAAALRGKQLFEGQATCANCHLAPTFTEPGFNMHKPEEICTDSFQADRSPDGMYRTTPLRGIWSHAKGGYYHDGRFSDLAAVVKHYDSCFGLNLSAGQQHDLVEYLKSL
jgi:mono/diheme cytochrome c family protein